MKKCQHQVDTFETALEQIEQMIECIDPDKKVRIGDITGRINPAIRNSDITKATVMLLKKYGIENKEESDG